MKFKSTLYLSLLLFGTYGPWALSAEDLQTTDPNAAVDTETDTALDADVNEAADATDNFDILRDGRGNRGGDRGGGRAERGDRGGNRGGGRVDRGDRGGNRGGGRVDRGDRGRNRGDRADRGDRRGDNRRGDNRGGDWRRGDRDRRDGGWRDGRRGDRDRRDGGWRDGRRGDRDRRHWRPPHHARRGHYPWPRWGRARYVRPIFYWDWPRLRLVTCTAEDSNGYLYPVVEEGYSGLEYRPVVYDVADAAINRCYYESGGDAGCHLLECHPGY